MTATTQDLADASQPAASYMERWKPEIDACLDVAFYVLSTSGGSSPGMKTFRITFSNKGNPYLLGVLVVCKWLYCRLHRISIHQHWRAAADGSLAKRLWRMIRVLDAIIHVMSFANQLSFISARATDETYPDLTSRLSGYGYSPLSRSPALDNNSTGAVTATRPPSTMPPPSSGVSRAEVQLRTRHEAWDALQGLALAIALLCDWRRLAVTLWRHALDLCHRTMHGLQQRGGQLSVGALYSSLLILIEKFIPDLLLQFLKPVRGAASIAAADSARAQEALIAATDSDACAICGLQPPEVRDYVSITLVFFLKINPMYPLI